MIPENRHYTVRFIDIENASVSVESGGNVIDCKVYANPLRIELPVLPLDNDIKIMISDPVVTKNPDIRHFATELLSRLEGGNVRKAIKNRKLHKAKTEKKFRKKLKRARFPKQVRKAAFELYE